MSIISEMQQTVSPEHFYIGLLIKYCNSNSIVSVGARCPS